jgi:AcrR family transcriptional regulator
MNKSSVVVPVALRLFATNRYEDVSVPYLVREAGISESTLRRAFDGKISVFNEIPLYAAELLEKEQENHPCFATVFAPEVSSVLSYVNMVLECATEEGKPIQVREQLPDVARIHQALLEHYKGDQERTKAGVLFLLGILSTYVRGIQLGETTWQKSMVRKLALNFFCGETHVAWEGPQALPETSLARVSRELRRLSSVVEEIAQRQ